MRKFEPEWLFYMDLDLVIADYRRSLTEFIKNDFDLILNDHNAHLNNGAFFIKNTPSMHNFLQNWRDLCERRKLSHVKWGTTDNGAMVFFLFVSEGNVRIRAQSSHSFRTLIDVMAVVNARARTRFGSLSLRSLEMVSFSECVDIETMEIKLFEIQR